MIGTVTLNPAIDRRYNVDKLDINIVKRTSDYSATAGGKGLNVSRVVRILGEKVLAFGFLGGSEGDFIQRKISELGIKSYFINIKGTTRTCLNIIDELGDNIEILEGGPTITKDEENRLLKVFKSQIDNLDVVTLSGSLPKGIDNDIYGKLIKVINEKGKKAILDTSGRDLIVNLDSRPFLVKPNREELENIIGGVLNTEEDIKKSAKKILDLGAQNIAISLGSEGMYFFGKLGNFKVNIPKIKAINPVGSGDSSIAGFAYGISKNLDIIEVLKYANACGVANAMEKETGKIDVTVVNEILEKIEVVIL
ncbi:1-phosphofructokinase [Clostridium sp. D2Q-11]|uniref:Tagatose-6-phosphate kinase n=1 Tax=Anaeromonas frigoriresistens TaxID=2683708 RepID=A0A942UU94_9FIRM|nr:1-phosphofructokinase [Anaeromonas frigoriresistens]MBS4538110.1 1-phosphofructokinase [Anaeromonas frigoriresistens]